MFARGAKKRRQLSIIFGWILIIELREWAFFSSLFILAWSDAVSENTKWSNRDKKKKKKKISAQFIEKRFKWNSFLLNRPIAICDSVTRFYHRSHFVETKAFENDKYIDEDYTRIVMSAAETKKQDTHTHMMNTPHTGFDEWMNEKKATIRKEKSTSKLQCERVSESKPKTHPRSLLIFILY